MLENVRYSRLKTVVNQERVVVFPTLPVIPTTFFRHILSFTHRPIAFSAPVVFSTSMVLPGTLYFGSSIMAATAPCPSASATNSCPRLMATNSSPPVISRELIDSRAATKSGQSRIPSVANKISDEMSMISNHTTKRQDYSIDGCGDGDLRSGDVVMRNIVFRQCREDFSSDAHMGRHAYADE